MLQWHGMSIKTYYTKTILLCNKEILFIISPKPLEVVVVCSAALSRAYPPFCRLWRLPV